MLRLALALIAAGTLSGCVTDGLLRIARNDADLQSVEGAWVAEDGGLVVRAEVALGTFEASPVWITVAADELEAAHASHGRPHRLERSALGGEASVEGLEPVAVEKAWSLVLYEWEPSELRPPEGADSAVFHEGRIAISFHLRPVRFAHARRGANGDWEVAVFELAPAEGGGRPAYYLPVPFTAAVEGMASILLFGLVLGLAPLL